MSDNVPRGMVEGRIATPGSSDGTSQTPLKGSVEFTRRTNGDRVGEPPSRLTDDVVSATLDEDGQVRQWLAIGRYRVRYRGHGGGTALPSHDIEVTEAHTVDNPLDLADDAPPPGPPLTPDQFAAVTARLAGLEARMAVVEAKLTFEAEVS